MAGIMEYLDWRGDLSFQEDPFNEVDNLILAQLSYVELDGYVPAPGSKARVTLREVSRAFFKEHTEKELMAVNTFIKMAPFLMKKMAQTRRFGECILSNYVNQIDYEHNKQFSALHIGLSDHTIYVAYRGTDDTIVGWKEDFMMCYETVPAQKTAVEYLNATIPFGFSKLRIGGHSKGGNLAIYGAVMCRDSLKRRIINVYSNDGPGFSPGFVATRAYQEMLPIIQAYVPGFSIIGRLLEHGEEYRVVESREKYLLQHDAMSWEVMGNHFCCLDELSQKSIDIDRRFSAWINGMNLKTRRQIVEGLFSALEGTGAKTLSDISATKWKNIPKILFSLSALDETAKSQILELIKG